MFEVFSRIMRRHDVKICGYYSPIGYAAERGLEIEGVLTGQSNKTHLPGFGPLFLSCVAESVREISKFKPDVIVVNNGYEFVKILRNRCKGNVIPYVGSTDWYKPINLLGNSLIWRVPYFQSLVSVAASSPTAMRTYFRPTKTFRGQGLTLRNCRVNICVSNYAISDCKEGSITYKGVWQGKSYEDRGVIKKIEPKKLLVSTYWSAFSGLPDSPENYSTVTYTLDEHDGETTLTVTQENISSKESADHSEGNWKIVLESLKNILEKSDR